MIVIGRGLYRTHLKISTNPDGSQYQLAHGLGRGSLRRD